MDYVIVWIFSGIIENMECGELWSFIHCVMFMGVGMICECGV